MKKTFQQRIWTAAVLAVLGTTLHAQVEQLSIQEYQDRKAAGTLPEQYHVAYSTLPVAGVTPETREKKHHGGQPKGGGGGQVNGNCNCWLEPDGSYTLAMQPNDDGSSGLINLPFSFNLYGDLYNSCYINNNGNVSFGSPYGTYSADPFPTGNFTMVAPFWADVDTRGDDGFGLNGGRVWYKITSTALYVNWVAVGYYGEHTDKNNTFQLIMTDGTDPVIGVGNTVSFCYRDMQWTTGDASQGQNGFGGIPSTVGANRGNGVDFIEFTRNDHPGTDYDGPFGNADGVDWLDYQNFQFTTAVSTQNIPPIVSSNFLCDTVQVCMGELVQFDVTFLTPEGDQLITNTTADGPTLSTFNYTIENNGINSTVHVNFIPTVVDTGYHTVTFTGQDNGLGNLVSTVSIVLQVYYTASPPPVITGDTVACEGQGVVLTAGPGYDNYVWTNGYDGTTVLVGPGTYICTATAGQCRLASNSITVTEAPLPTPTIEGAQAQCGGVPSVLSTSQTYTSYLWSTGSPDPSITVGTGTYSVTVTDDNGCSGSAPSVNVVAAPNPTALFANDPNGPVFPGTTVDYTDASNGNGANIVSHVWTVNGDPAGNGAAISYLFDTPGNYVISLTVTTADGCTNTYLYTQIVKPTEIIVPNVFSPNGDGHNDLLEFTGLEYYNNKLQVFNRWGQSVYEATNYKNTWSAPGIPEGTYFFVLKLDNGKEYSGPVTLLR